MHLKKICLVTLFWQINYFLKFATSINTLILLQCKIYTLIFYQTKTCTILKYLFKTFKRQSMHIDAFEKFASAKASQSDPNLYLQEIMDSFHATLHFSQFLYSDNYCTLMRLKNFHPVPINWLINLFCNLQHDLLFSFYLNTLWQNFVLGQKSNKMSPDEIITKCIIVELLSLVCGL